MSIRSQWCEFDKETRKYIKKRDENRCIFCGNNGALQIAHIFLSRAHGGRGCKENGILLCIKCHNALDNGKDINLRNKIYNFCIEYLIKKEKIINITELMKTLKYDKINTLRNSVKIEPPIRKIENKCKNCIMLEKKIEKYNSIPIYICKLKKKRISKNNEICNKFQRK